MSENRKPHVFSREATTEQSNLLLLSERKAFTMETKFITHLNEKYLTKTIKNSPPNSTIPLELQQIPLQTPQKSESPEEKKEASSHKKHKKLKIITDKTTTQYEATPSPTKRGGPSEKEQKPAGLVRSNTMSPTKPALKPRFSDESPRKRKHRVKFNKKEQVFKVENFKAELKRLKFTTDY